MITVVNAVWILAVIGAACAVVLIAAAKFMAVPVDEKFPLIRDCLAGANCGACGFAGCDGYAQALVDGTETNVTLCTPGGKVPVQEGEQQIASTNTKGLQTTAPRTSCSADRECARRAAWATATARRSARPKPSTLSTVWRRYTRSFASDAASAPRRALSI